MAKELEYFKDFLASPKSFRNQEFYQWIREWAAYIRENDFDYGGDDWREIRESIADEINKRDYLKAEFERLIAKLNAAQVNSEKINVFCELLSFMRATQFEFDFPKETIACYEALLESVIRAERACRAADEKLSLSEMKYQKSIEKLDDTLAEQYEDTGKRPVVTTLQLKKRFREINAAQPFH